MSLNMFALLQVLDIQNSKIFFYQFTFQIAWFCRSLQGKNLMKTIATKFTLSNFSSSSPSCRILLIFKNWRSVWSTLTSSLSLPLVLSFQINFEKLSDRVISTFKALIFKESILNLIPFVAFSQKFTKKQFPCQIVSVLSWYELEFRSPGCVPWCPDLQ